MAFVVAIGGPTAAGKSTLVASLKAHYSPHLPVFHLLLDDYYQVCSTLHAQLLKEAEKRADICFEMLFAA